MRSPIPRTVLGKGQLYFSIVGMVGFAISVVYTIAASQSCTGLGCTSALLGLLTGAASLSVSLLAIPAYGWMKGKRWAPIANLVLILPLVLVCAYIIGIGYDVAAQSKRHSTRPNTVASQWSPVTRATVDTIFSEIESFAFGVQRIPGNELLWRTAPPAPDFRLQPKAYQLITEKEASAVIHYLADDGFFDRLHNEQASPFVPPPGSYLLIHVSNGADILLTDRVPWTATVYERNGSKRPPSRGQLYVIKGLVYSPGALTSLEAVLSE